MNLPRHQWVKIEATGPGGKERFGPDGLWIWGCRDCLQTCWGSPDPAEPPPDNDFCLGKGPHTPAAIASVKRAFAYLGWKAPERLREG